MKFSIIINKLTSRSETGFRDRQEKEEKEKKKSDNFDALIRNEPNVALAIFFRDLEDRLLSIMFSAAEQAGVRGRLPARFIDWGNLNTAWPRAS